MTWQRDLARTRQPRLTKLAIPPAALCVCGHPKSSHTASVFSGKCHVRLLYDGMACDCLAFDARCGCGHLLSSHAWGTPPSPWACSSCICRQFGARSE